MRLPLTFLLAAIAVNAQQGAASGIIRTETRTVLVDSVVTDKKGAYIRGLERSDFRLWEDNREQPISSLAFEGDTASAPDRTQRLILFFDMSTAALSDEGYTRRAATQFIEAIVKSGCQVAVMEFDGFLRVTQNFTGDVDRLKQAVAGLRLREGKTGLRYAGPSEPAVKGVLDALRRTANGLAAIPGRKTLVLLSAGFLVSNENRAELNAAISVSNRNNVAIYPIDVRGLPGSPPSGGNSGVVDDSGAGLSNQSPFFTPIYKERRIPPIPNDLTAIAGPRRVLYTLASETGGFVIANTNDLLGGMERIGREQSEHYVIGFTPGDAIAPYTCHSLRVKVNRSGAEVRSRSGYCDAKPLDILSGTEVERGLEDKIDAGAKGNIQASMQAPFFYTPESTARVHLALEIPGKALTFSKERGMWQAALDVVGIVSFVDGGVAARFSDVVRVQLDTSKKVSQFEKTTYHYEKEFELAPGNYTLQVAFSGGQLTFGREKAALMIEALPPGAFGLSGLALSTSTVAVAHHSSRAVPELNDDEMPLVVNGYRLIPSGRHDFRKSDPLFVYSEIYEPGLAIPDEHHDPGLSVSVVLLDPRNGAVVKDLGISRILPAMLTGRPVVPIGIRLPLDSVPDGEWTVVVTAMNGKNQAFSRTIGIRITE